MVHGLSSRFLVGDNLEQDCSDLCISGYLQLIMLFTFVFALQKKTLQSVPPSTALPHHSMSRKAVVPAPVKAWSSSSKFM